jgi:hypothetical protein
MSSEIARTLFISSLTASLRIDCTKQKLELTAWLTWGIPLVNLLCAAPYVFPQVNQAVYSNLCLMQSALKSMLS